MYGKIVSYVITLFNGVDMLYSKLRNTKIQINIAGIIIGTVSILNWKCVDEYPNLNVLE